MTPPPSPSGRELPLSLQEPSTEEREYRSLLASEDFILSGTQAFESLTKHLPSLKWLHREGDLVYRMQNIATFKASPRQLVHGSFQQALQGLAGLSGLATLTHCYQTLLKNLWENEKVPLLLAKKKGSPSSPSYPKWEGQALSVGGGKVINHCTDDPGLLNLLLKNSPRSEPVVFTCRSLKQVEDFLTTHQEKDPQKSSGVWLAFHQSLKFHSLIPHIPFHQKVGLWGNVLCEDLKNFYHSRWDFVLPESLSYPPAVDLFVKHS